MLSHNPRFLKNALLPRVAQYFLKNSVELSARGSRLLSSMGYEVTVRKTYLEEEFWTAKPEGPVQELPASDSVEPIKLHSLNHLSFEATDVNQFADFYVKVLGFEKLPRPNFKFGGAWLKNGDVVMHVIDKDPTVPRKESHWQERYKETPEPWMVRRGRHTAFEVGDVEAVEKKLREMGIQYDKFIIPNANSFQLFIFDPEGNGIELGNYTGVAAALAARDAAQGNEK